MIVEDVYAPAFHYRYRCQWTGPDGTPHVELYREQDIEPVPDER
jgi:hypothetical protein